MTDTNPVTVDEVAQRTRLAVEDEERLATLRRLALLDTPAEEAFDRLTQLASKIIDAPVALVSLVDRDRQFFKSHVGLAEPWASQRETPLSHSFCQHAVASGEPLVVEDAREDPLLRENLAIPDLGVIAYAGIPLITDAGHALGSFCVIDSEPRKWTADELETLRDLAAGVMSEIELRAQNERLRELDRLKDEFVGLISHELRTPLTSINGYLNVLLEAEGSTSPDRQREFLEVIDRNTQRLSHLVNDLLFVAQVRAGEFQISHNELDLEAVLTDCVRSAQLQATERELDLTLESNTVPVLFGDATRLAQLFDNLITNAIKFTPEGGRVEVKLNASDDREAACISVRDTGIGLTEAEREEVFERFTRSDAARENAIPGSGLGLTIARAIVEAHRGQIHLTSRPGQGTTVTVTLPPKGT